MIEAEDWTLEGKNVLVTGGSSGIGAALAEGFAARGATVGICARRADRLAEVLERLREHSPGSRSWVVDLADFDAVDDLARRASDELGGIDLLVNNAGIPKRRGVRDTSPDVVQAVMRINYLSPVRLTLDLLPEIVERNGRVLFVSSVAARLSPPHEASYAASKAAITAWAECMQVDLGDTGVKVHVVNPGVIDTELFHLPDNEESIADIEALPVEAIVEPVVRQLESGTFEIYVPEWFADIAAHKISDVGAFLEGSITYSREQGVYD